MFHQPVPPDSFYSFGPLAVGTGLMAGALAFQVWLSVAKPWGRTGLGHGKPPPAPMWLLVSGVAAPVLDTTAGIVLGHPLPVVSLAALGVAAAWRIGAGRRAGGPTATGGAHTGGRRSARSSSRP